MENITFIIPLNSDNKGPIFVQKTLKGLISGELIFGGACYPKEFCVSKWVRLVFSCFYAMKTAKNTKITA